MHFSHILLVLAAASAAIATPAPLKPPERLAFKLRSVDGLPEHLVGEGGIVIEAATENGSDNLRREPPGTQPPSYGGWW
ncbi:hypothetical protein JVU11DRAFT_8310 [Chiua virens]|nr:hypothetical protein JVU11DRAFT_8310 [Chiua virens]